jgi:hypothetical protein
LGNSISTCFSLFSFAFVVHLNIIPSYNALVRVVAHFCQFQCVTIYNFQGCFMCMCAYVLAGGCVRVCVRVCVCMCDIVCVCVCFLYMLLATWGEDTAKNVHSYAYSVRHNSDALCYLR